MKNKPERVMIGTPEWVAFVNISVLPFFNILTLLGLYALVTGVNFSSHFINGLELGLSFIVFMGINYYSFLYKKKYKRIVESFETENEEESHRRNRYVILYIFTSLGLFFIILTLKGMIEKRIM